MLLVYIKAHFEFYGFLLIMDAIFISLNLVTKVECSYFQDHL